MLSEYERRLFGECYSDLEQRMRSDAGLARALDALAERYVEDGMAVTDLARAAGMSATVLRERFRRLAGLSPRKFTIRYRAMKALEMLGSSECSISEIAMSVGFSDLGALVKTFRNLLGERAADIRMRVKK